MRGWLFVLMLCALGARPTPAAAWSHIVVVILENRDFGDIIGNPTDAPYINTVLVRQGTTLTQSLAIGHPSQPNYLRLFSGSDQGMEGHNGPVPGSLAPPDRPVTGEGLTTPNLGAAVLRAGGTYATYSESLTEAGDPLAYYGGGKGGQLYARKHNPGTNWIARQPQGNQVSAATNRDFSAFPAGDFDRLPTLSLVIPNQCNDAHGADGDCPSNMLTYKPLLRRADAWVQANLDAYAQWAPTHDSLLILTFDEGLVTVGAEPGNGPVYSRVATVLVGAGVPAAKLFGGTVTHYGLCAFIARTAGPGAEPPGRCADAEPMAQADALAVTLGVRIMPTGPARAPQR